MRSTDNSNLVPKHIMDSLSESSCLIIGIVNKILRHCPSWLARQYLLFLSREREYIQTNDTVKHKNKMTDTTIRISIRLSAVVASTPNLSLNGAASTTCTTVLFLAPSIKAGTMSSQNEVRGAPKSVCAIANAVTSGVNLIYSLDSSV